MERLNGRDFHGKCLSVKQGMKANNIEKEKQKRQEAEELEEDSEEEILYLRVRHLNLTTTAERVGHLFEQVGDVKEARILCDGEQSLGKGVVWMKEEESVEEAERRLNGAVVDGSTIAVEVVRRCVKVSRKTSSVRVFVSNLSPTTTAQHIGKLFEEVGTVEEVVLASENKHSLGYGYVKMRSREDAVEAVETLDGHCVDGSEMIVSCERRGRDEGAADGTAKVRELSSTQLFPDESEIYRKKESLL